MIDVIPLIGLIIAFLSFAFTQWRATKLDSEKEERIETKLTIFYALRDDELSEQELMSRLNQARPTSPLSTVVVKKCLYEMLAENTVDYTDEGLWAASVSVDDD